MHRLYKYNLQFVQKKLLKINKLDKHFFLDRYALK